MDQNLFLEFSMGDLPKLAAEVVNVEVTREGINEDYCGKVILKSPVELPMKVLLAKEALLQFTSNHQKGFLRGLLHKAQENRIAQHWEYSLVISAPLTHLQYQSHQRVFVEKHLSHILQMVLKNLPAVTVDIRLSKEDIFCPFIPQHNESDYDFFQGLVVRYGLLYCYRYDDDKLTLIVSDDLKNLPGNEIVHTVGEGEGFVTSKKSFFNVTERDYLQDHQHKKQIIAQCDDISLQIGDIVTLDAKQSYRVSQKKQLISQNSNLLFHSQENQRAYLQSVTLIPLNQSFIHTTKKRKTYSCNLVATIASPTTEPYLDDRGGYRAQFNFDNETQNPLEGSASLVKLQFFGGKDSVGFHFPLPPQVSSVVGFVESDGENPVILGVLPTSTIPSPVTSLNCMEVCWRTRCGNEMRFNGEDNKVYLSLHTLDKAQEILLSEEKDNCRMELLNKKGTIQFSAQSSVNIRNAGSENNLISKNHQLDTKGDFTFVTGQGSLQLIAGQEISFSSQKNLTLMLSKSLEASAEGGVLFYAGNDFNLDVIKGSAKMSALHGQVIFDSQGNLSLKSLQGDILLENSKGFIKLQKNGFVSLSGHSLTFKAENIYIKNATWING